MKKFIFSLAAFAAMATACQVEDINETATPAGETFTITADIAATKTSLTVGEDGYKVDWEADDALSVVAKYADGSYAGYEFTKGEGNTFSGEVNNAANIEEVYVLYPYDSYQKSINEQYGTLNGYIGIGEKLSQSGVDNTEHIDGNLYGYSTVTEGTAKVDMKHATTLFEIILTNNSGADMEIANISLSDSKGSKLTGKFYINPVSGELQAASSAISSASLSTVNATLENGVTRKFYITTAPFELAADENITINVTASDGATASVVKTIPDAEHGKFVAGTVNHINVTLDEVQEAEKIEPGEYLIAGHTSRDKWGIMTGNSNDGYFTSSSLASLEKSIADISCADFYSISGIADCVWTLAVENDGYSIKNASGYLTISEGDVLCSSEAVALVITKNIDGTYYIQENNTSEYKLRYNAGAGRFKPYKDSSNQNEVVLIPWTPDISPRIIVPETSKTVDPDMASIIFEYDTNNIDGTISASESSDVDNIISDISVTETQIEVTLVPNDEEKAKTATITLSYPGAESVELTINQKAMLPELEHPFTSTIEWKPGDKGYNQEGNINGESGIPVLKLGTGSASGKATFTIPAGTVKIGFYALSWKGESCSMTFDVNGTETTITPAANSGLSGNYPYTLEVTESDYYTLDVNAVEQITVTTGGDYRGAIFGINPISE